ncbi:MAG: hypothetical protein ACRETQ_09745 [Gammaproteobacteria bacterium]
MVAPVNPATSLCPNCGKPTAPGGRCVHCGAALGIGKARQHLRPSDAPSSDFGIYLLATPVVAAIVALMVALATHSVAGVIAVLVVMAVVTAGFAATEYFRAPGTWDRDDAGKATLGWLGFVLVLWPAGFPVYLCKRRRLQLDNWLVGALLVEAVLAAGVVLSGVVIYTGYGKPSARQVAAQRKHSNPQLLAASPKWIPDPGDAELVRTSYLDNCKQRTVEQEVNAYLGSPRWEAGADAGGRDFVNVSGIVTYRGKPVPAVFQFIIDADKRGFKYHAFAINGVPQTIYVAALTLMEMCAAANQAPMIVIPQGTGQP